MGQYDIVLIARRGAERGGTRFNHRGINDEGFVANYCQLEMIYIRKSHTNSSEFEIFSHCQVRGTFPFHWKQFDVKDIRVTKSVEATLPATETHMQMLFDRYCQDVEDKSIYSLNLVRDRPGKELKLTKHYEKVLEALKEKYSKKNQKIGYINFDWHRLTSQGTEPFDTFLDEINDEYLDKFNIYKEVRNEFTKEGRVEQLQKGVVRTNCVDCLDRTNVAKMKICLRAFRDKVWRGVEEIQEGYTDSDDRESQAQEYLKEIEKAAICMWALAGDIISRIYSGTESVLTAVTLKGHEDLGDKINHYMTSANRWKIQKFSDDFKHECVQILSGKHPSSVNSQLNILAKQMSFPKSTETFLMFIATINCNFRRPTTYFNVAKLLKPQNKDDNIDIFCVNLQRIAYRGKRTIFNTDIEQAPGQEWIEHLPQQLH